MNEIKPGDTVLVNGQEVPATQELADRLNRRIALMSEVLDSRPCTLEYLFENKPLMGPLSGSDVKDPYIRIHARKFRFPHKERRNNECIKNAFKHNGFEVADISRQSPCWTWVLTTDGNLWLHDTSHGCGGEFSIYSSAK